MELHNLKPAKGSTGRDRRLGRGQGSGRGGTSTRGHKGQKSRSGYSRNFGFEGGQMPLQRRVPKYGFKNINRKEYKAINISILQELADKQAIKKIDPDVLMKAGLISKHTLVKILGNGNLTSKLEVRAHAFSASAKKAIEELGGSTENI
ncbi:MAG: 50S ribosomal protein L15 [Bacteroides sp. SM23_62_1]|nr:MAG: 50S ribosomal protein L15 [Bacteroides sp. SM23_62_1]